MKYWIYKDSRILGPYDKDAMAGMPGFNGSTMVCAGENAGAEEGQWSPAADIPELAQFTQAHSATWASEDPESSFGFLDKLQIESAGLIGDVRYPSADEVLFQDAEIKKSFSEMLVERTHADDAEVRRLRGLVSELSVQLELMYRRIAQLENTHAEFLQRFALSESLAQARVESAPAAAIVPPAPLTTPAPDAEPVPPPPEENFSAFSSPESSAAEPALERRDEFEVPELPLDAAVPVLPQISTPSLETFLAEEAVAPQQEPAAFEFLPAAPEPALDAAPELSEMSTHELPPMPELKPIDTAALEELIPSLLVQPPTSESDVVSVPEVEPAPMPEPEPEPFPSEVHKIVFDKPKTFRVIPTVKSFPVVDSAVPGEAEAPPAAEMPPPEAAEPPAHEPAALPPMPNLAPPSAVPLPVSVAEAAPAEEIPVPNIASNPVPVPLAAETPSDPAPLPVQAVSPIDVPPSANSDAFPNVSSLPMAGVSSTLGPPVTAVFSGSAPLPPEDPPAPMPATKEVLARLAKPVAAPVGVKPQAPRRGKKFVMVVAILAAALVLLLGFFLWRTRVSDLNRMASLDDGKPQLGAEPIDDATHPPLDKPTPNPASTAAPAAPEGPAGQEASTVSPIPAAPAAPAAAPAPSPADMAVSFVKNFPLDGNRGTVSKWLDFSYMATPDAGQSVWSAAAQPDETFLVEYRFEPAIKGAPEVVYVFQADPQRGYVLGKNQDAKALLAGGGPRLGASAAPAKSQPRRRAKRTSAAPSALPSAGELQAPSEDGGDFGSDAAKSGR